eukprot:1476264-Alexandrium_andersonii.AAC.1
MRSFHHSSPPKRLYRNVLCWDLVFLLMVSRFLPLGFWFRSCTQSRKRRCFTLSCRMGALRGAWAHMTMTAPPPRTVRRPGARCSHA